MKYNNRVGRVSKITQDAIYIDGVEFSTVGYKSKSIISASHARVGDEVIFNAHCISKEIIFLRLTHPYYKGSGYNRSGAYGYTEDPRDPDEVHDMEAAYGHSFEGM